MNAPQDPERLRQAVTDALRGIYDPEIPLNIYELGLIYDIHTDRDGRVAILMTLTSPACAVAGALPEQVRRAALEVDGVASAKVDLVWDPPWGPERLSDEARLTLGLL